MNDARAEPQQARVLLVSYAEPGHVIPLANVAQALIRRGHRVSWTFPFLYPGQSLAAELETFTGEVLPTVGVELPAWFAAEARQHHPPPPGADRQPLLELVSRVARELLPDLVRFIRRQIRESKADVVALDTISTVGWPGTIAAVLEGVPHVGLSTNLSGLAPSSREALGEAYTSQVARSAERAAFRAHDCRDFGVSSRLVSEPFPFAQVFFTTREFVGDEVSIPRTARLVGPARALQTLQSADTAAGSRRLVLVSFGTQVTAQPKALTTVAEAAAPLGLELLVSGGALANTPFALGLPGRVTVLPRLAQRGELARAQAFITHGGCNSVTEGLDAGVPLLVSPVDCDQPLNARFVALSGAGVVLDLRTATVEACRAALQSLTAATSPYAEHARRIQSSFRKLDGAMGAALVIESVAERSRLARAMPPTRPGA